MRSLSRRIEMAVIGAHEFVSNTWYWLDKGFSLRKAVSLARDTLPNWRK